MDEEFLLVIINKSAHTVAECGKQLSCLGAAMHKFCGSQYTLHCFGCPKSLIEFDMEPTLGNWISQ